MYIRLINVVIRYNEACNTLGSDQRHTQMSWWGKRSHANPEKMIALSTTSTTFTWIVMPNSHEFAHQVHAKHRLQTPLSNSRVGKCRKICLLVRIVQDIGILPILWLKNYFAKTICLFVCNEHTTIINRRVQSKCAPQKGSTAITTSRQVTSTYCTQQTASAYSSRWSLDAGATTSIINRRVQSKCAPQKSSPAITTSRQVTSAYCTQQTASAFSSR